MVKLTLKGLEFDIFLADVEELHKMAFDAHWM
jgi:hypothetical protein